jgi:hypothetical protein
MYCTHVPWKDSIQSYVCYLCPSNSVLCEPDGQCVILPGKQPQYHAAFLAATCYHSMVHVSVNMSAVKEPASTIIAAKSAAQPHCAFQLVMCSWPSMLQL